jgi:hypothetical protein
MGGGMDRLVEKSKDSRLKNSRKRERKKIGKHTV